MTKHAFTQDTRRMLAVFGPALKIIEAKTALRTTIMPRHSKNATPGNGMCCAIAKALGGADVAVLRTFTFIREAGATYVTKYQNGADAEAFTSMFDKGMVMTKPIDVVFLPVPVTHRKANLAKRHQRRKSEAARLGYTPRAYRKPSVKTATIVIAKGRSRIAVHDKSQRCATRYNNMAA